MTAMTRHRPFGVTLLAIFAAVSAVTSLWYTLQYLHILPFTLGPVQFYSFDLLGAVLWGITTAIWVWATINLWNLNPQALMFVVFLAGWNIILALLSWLGASSFQAELPALLINALVLLYGMSPQVRMAFARP